jgi:hypothetical protein
MKKQFLTLIVFAAGITAANAQCGSVITRTWDGGGADENFFTPENWTNNTVPDCNDNVAFGNVSNKNCEIPDSFITTGIINVNPDYKGRIVVSGTATVIEAAGFNMDATVVTFNPEIGHCRFGSVSVGSNGLMNYSSRAGMSISATLTLDAGGFISFRTGSTVNLNALVVNAFSQMKCPEKGIVNITGNIQKAKISTFDARSSTWNINGAVSQSVSASHGGSGANTSAGAIKFWNVNLNKPAGTVPNPDNWTLTDGTDTVIIENRLTVIAGDLTGGFMFHDTLELLGEGRDGHSGTNYCGGNKTADLILNNNLIKGSSGVTLIVKKESNGSILNFRKGSHSEVTMPAAIINAERGTIAFPDDVTVNIPNRPFTIGANATLNMPAAATVKMDATNISIPGTVVPNQSTLEFTGTNTLSTSFGGGARRAFYNITVNTANASAPINIGSNDTIEVLNDLVITKGMFTYLTVASDEAVVYVNGNLHVQSSGSANTYSSGQIIVLGGNTNTEYRGDVLIPSGRIIIDKASSSNIVSAVATGNTISVGATNTTNNGLDVRRGTLSFDDKNAVIATGAGVSVKFLVGANGCVEAPATDTLAISGSWNFANRNSLKAKNGTISLGTTSNQYNMNGAAVIFNNLLQNGGGNRTFNSTDSVIVKGNLRQTTGNLNGANLVFEGNFTASSGGMAMTTVKAMGGNNQTISFNDQDLIRDEGLTLDKTAGTVTCASAVRLNSLRLNKGLLNSGGQTLTIFGANSIFAGNSTSFIEGAVTISSTSAWSGSRYFIPVGRGNQYRPVQLHASNTTNVWTVTYVASDTATDLGNAGTHGIDAFSTSEYWIVQRSGGAGASNAAFVQLSTLGKDAGWNDADIRIARWNASGSTWSNYGPNTGASSDMVLASTSDWTSNGARVFTIGVDNVPAPIAVRNEGISGNELNLVSNSQNGNSQAVAQAAISFNVFPNPVAETLNIALSGANKGTITLSDLSGKVLGVYSAETRSINMSSFAAGVYFATFSNGSQRITQRVIRN